MGEISQEVRTFEVHYICDECGKGEMKASGACLMSNPPQFPHRCQECGAEKTMFNKAYPFTTYEKIP